MGVHHFRKSPMYVGFKIYGEKRRNFNSHFGNFGEVKSDRKSSISVPKTWKLFNVQNDLEIVVIITDAALMIVH